MHRPIPRRRRYGCSRKTHHNHVACRTLIDDKSCGYGFNDLELFRSKWRTPLSFLQVRSANLWRTSEEDIECVEELAGWLLQPLRRSFSLRRRVAVAVRSPSR